MDSYYYYIFIPILLALFFLSGVYSGCETAYSTLTKAKIYEMVENKEKFSKIIEKHSNRYNRILTTILIANNIVNVLSATMTALLLGKVFENYTNASFLTTIISTALVTPLLVIFGEITPKLLAKTNPKKFLKMWSWWIDVNYWFFWVLTWPISKLSKKVYVTHSEEDLKNIINIAQNEGVLQTGESLLAQNALDLDSTKVSSHYIRMKDVTYLNYKTSIADALKVFAETNYSRIPIEKDKKMIGIVLLKDIFLLKKGQLLKYVKQVPQISSNSILSSALEKMRSAQAQMAFVVENNSSTDVLGIITIEDIVEEIVGEIYDEYDDDEQIYEISLEKSRVQSDVIMWDLFKQLEIDSSLLEDSEHDLTLRDFILLKTSKTRLYKNARYVLNDKVAFKIIEISKEKKKISTVEVTKL
ncbi:HlyC/CorC family transporter [Mycoplasma sp. CSL10137]|uniref:hemolysin family protein n=1 Tax=Mycoplasma sp. CSL10137 TaxID=2813824 RepID=UPI00197BA78E|nr:hemolysin family protein [Mycoplasma sp. CSL10137]MBN4083520.1 HlyC/CorC family transporter [Mycoplasma sp. CSL10137]